MSEVCFSCGKHKHERNPRCVWCSAEKSLCAEKAGSMSDFIASHDIEAADTARISELEAEVEKLRAEVKRFRDREEKVTELIAWASQALESVPGEGDPDHEDYVTHHQVREAINAVRDFKVTP